MGKKPKGKGKRPEHRGAQIRAARAALDRAMQMATAAAPGLGIQPGGPKIQEDDPRWTPDIGRTQNTLATAAEAARRNPRLDPLLSFDPARGRGQFATDLYNPEGGPWWLNAAKRQGDRGQPMPEFRPRKPATPMPMPQIGRAPRPSY